MKRIAFVRALVIVSLLSVAAPLTASAQADPWAQLRAAVVPIEARVTTDDERRGVLQFKASLTGIRLGDGSFVLAPAYLERVSFEAMFLKPSHYTQYVAVEEDREEPLTPLCASREVVLFRAAPSRPGFDSSLFSDMPGQLTDVALVRTGNNAAVSFAAVSPIKTVTDSCRFACMPATPYFHGWLGALCCSRDGSALYGILSDYEPDMRDDGVVYSYSLNGTPAISFPNGIVSLLDNRDIQYLLDNYRAIEYARFAWLGIACRLEALTQPATLALAVEKVKPHSLAAFAGFLPQDKIVKLDNAPIACESKRFPVVAQPPTGNAAQPRVFTILRGQNETLSLDVPVMPADTFAPVCLKKSGIVVQRAFPHGPAEGCAFEVMSLGPDCVIKGLHLGDVVLFDREVPADALEAELAKYPLRLLRGAIELTIGA